MELRSPALAVALLALASAQALAQGQQAPPQGPHGRLAVNQSIASACKTELQQLCQGKTGQAAQQCLQSNESKLSSQCKGAVSKTSQN
jgi:hypothetical protein